MSIMTHTQQNTGLALRDTIAAHPKAAGIAPGTGIGKLIHGLIYMPNWLQVVIILGGATLLLLLWRLDSRGRHSPDTGEPEANGPRHIVFTVVMALLAVLILATLFGAFAGTYLMTVNQTF